MSAGATVVIPCYNEADRLREEDVARLLEDERLRVLLVDDGSTDDTSDLLARIAADLGDRADFVVLPQNGGKAEAVRRGMLRAIGDGAPLVGYLDADFATPAEEMHRLLDVLEATDTRAAMGSRFARLGADIQRSPVRHYLGRVFATAASLVLRLRVYDCQCGAKLFRVDPTLELALSQPFRSRWIFDVELLGRLLAGGPGAPGWTADDLVEVPLERWHDVSGSKLSRTAMLRAGAELLSLACRTPRR
ncbi:MAG: glycosyltransferase [Myxococcota bacterium]